MAERVRVARHWQSGTASALTCAEDLLCASFLDTFFIFFFFFFQVLYFFIYSKHSYYISVKYQILHHFIFPRFGQVTKLLYAPVFLLVHNFREKTLYQMLSSPLQTFFK